MKVTDIAFESAENVVQEIRNMNVKGGSPFGRAAASAFLLCCQQEQFRSVDSLRERLNDLASQMMELKPTMGTIANAAWLMNRNLERFKGDSVEEAKASVCALCENIIAHSWTAVEKLGKFGANLIFNGAVVMMHSYSSTLMEVFAQAAANGTQFSVICTESRPLRESRVAVKMLRDIEVPVTYITDAEIWEFLPTVDLVIMGADTVAWDGSVANKIGTAMISQLALACKIPVYIATEIFKLDRRTSEGMPVLLERRSQEEVVFADDFDGKAGVEVINQFFDLTPACQIRGLITEFGVIAPATVSMCWEKFETELLQ